MRKDSGTVQFPVMKVVLSLASILWFHLTSVDIKISYHNGSKKVHLYAPSTRLCFRSQNSLEDPEALLRYRRIGKYLAAPQRRLATQKRTRGHTRNAASLHRDDRGFPHLALSKLLGDLHISDLLQHIGGCLSNLPSRFTVSRIVRDEHLLFNLLSISRADDGGVLFNTKEYYSLCSTWKKFRPSF